MGGKDMFFFTDDDAEYSHEIHVHGHGEADDHVVFL